MRREHVYWVVGEPKSWRHVTLQRREAWACWNCWPHHHYSWAWPGTVPNCPKCGLIMRYQDGPERAGRASGFSLGYRDLHTDFHIYLNGYGGRHEIWLRDWRSPGYRIW